MKANPSPSPPTPLPEGEGRFESRWRDLHANLAAVDAAELHLIQSKRNVRQSVDRTRSALHSAIARPSTLLLVALASGVSVYLFSSRHRPSVKCGAHSAQSADSADATGSTRPPEAADSPNRTSSRSLLRTFVSMYGVRVLTLVLQLGAAAGKQKKLNGARVDANQPSTSITGASATT